MKWEPIETAPKDGTPVLTTDRKLVGVAKWRDGFWVQEGYYDGEHLGMGRTYRLRVPTHWMPLPKPPSSR